MSRLLKNSESFRNQNQARNTYTDKNYYNTGHPNALSDGDEKGKGAQGQQVGSATDISKRQQLSSKNLFNKNNQYNINNA